MKVPPVVHLMFHAESRTDGQMVTHDELDGWSSQFPERN